MFLMNHCDYVSAYGFVPMHQQIKQGPCHYFTNATDNNIEKVSCSGSNFSHGGHPESTEKSLLSWLDVTPITERTPYKLIIPGFRKIAEHCTRMREFPKAFAKNT
jgi:hypothetical protein